MVNALLWQNVYRNVIVCCGQNNQNFNSEPISNQNKQ